MAFAMIFAGCKKVDVDFNYSPTEPRAGQLVKFSNQSSAGENWSWDFGDNTNSVLKNPSHTFKKPGTYVVTLMVDSAKYNTCSHTVILFSDIHFLSPLVLILNEKLFLVRLGQEGFELTAFFQKARSIIS